MFKNRYLYNLHSSRYRNLKQETWVIGLLNTLRHHHYKGRQLGILLNPRKITKTKLKILL